MGGNWGLVCKKYDILYNCSIGNMALATLSHFHIPQPPEGKSLTLRREISDPPKGNRRPPEGKSPTLRREIADPPKGNRRPPEGKSLTSRREIADPPKGNRRPSEGKSPTSRREIFTSLPRQSLSLLRRRYLDPCPWSGSYAQSNSQPHNRW